MLRIFPIFWFVTIQIGLSRNVLTSGIPSCTDVFTSMATRSSPMKESLRLAAEGQVRLDLPHAEAGMETSPIRRWVAGGMEMRKTCRWLGCAALLCITAVGLSGCTSKPLISRNRLPWNKDRSSVAKKDAKSTEDAPADLLTQAREFEKAGDFPQATRAYREYLKTGGQAKELELEESTESVAKSSRKPSEKSVALEDRPSKATPAQKPAIRPAAKTKSKSKPKAKTPAIEHERSTTSLESGTAEDPWAQDAAEMPVNPTHAPIQKKTSAKQSKTLAASTHSHPTEELPVWAEESSEEPVASDDSTLVSREKSARQTDITPQDLENLVNTDAGKIDWGDESSATEIVAAPPHEEVEEASTELASNSESSASQDIPKLDFNAPLDDWSSHGSAPRTSPELAMADTAEGEVSRADQFESPILDETTPETDADLASDLAPAKTGSIALACKNCEPWVYAQAMKLESLNPEVRKEGLTRLADMGQKASPACPAIQPLLQDPDPLVQAQAAWAMWEITSDPWESVGSLRPLLDHSHADVVELACYILGDIGAQAESATGSLELLRDHSDGIMCVHAAEALIRIQGVDQKSVTVLTEAMKSKDNEERWIAAVALGHCRGDNSAPAVEALTTALSDVDPEVRSAAALSLGGLGKDATQAKPDLERVARSDDPQVRDAARAALACLNR